jgi:hypothetical protein
LQPGGGWEEGASDHQCQTEDDQGKQWDGAADQDQQAHRSLVTKIN